MAKKKLSYIQRREQEAKMNSKALIWIGIGFALIVILMAVLLIINR